jgi:hypothetical protein
MKISDPGLIQISDHDQRPRQRAVAHRRQARNRVDYYSRGGGLTTVMAILSPHRPTCRPTLAPARSGL